MRAADAALAAALGLAAVGGISLMLILRLRLASGGAP
ncbi:hypothetical protein IBTHAUMO2_1130008 [Nitrosopumilaceae archaeon]|nr:hypothetical protein IBTHAUMO2_1130008 [Nitrosopumilaceae archaeon]